MANEVTPAIALAVGLNCIGFGPERTQRHCDKTKLDHFQGAYGVDPDTCSLIFREIQVRGIGDKAIDKPKLPHFLMTLHWLKRYPVEQQMSAIFGYHEDTVRKWVWKYCSAIQELKIYKVRMFIYMDSFLL